MKLIDRCPRLGVAHRAEQICWLDGRRVADVTDHDHAVGPCSTCGRLAHRHTIRFITRVGANRGNRGVYFTEDCAGGHGWGSNYRAPWASRGA